jgi:hypothetical protein
MDSRPFHLDLGPEMVQDKAKNQWKNIAAIKMTTSLQQLN